ncbi:hypothetical protein [Mycolicibacter kumamotonensis]|uniref:Uncharacterized protein n=1 Tax=Mycolicibacter kumamotonensis TaxID=354243 RepID=A0A1B8SL27_9MYCO|nr:hypothetical protein [Mycolicibacter kumamotonensis]OBY33466.1 hypothetical protein ACT18_00515 [Mycolicibacter kumamotonensis]
MTVNENDAYIGMAPIVVVDGVVMSGEVRLTPFNNDSPKEQMRQYLTAVAAALNDEVGKTSA